MHIKVWRVRMYTLILRRHCMVEAGTDCSKVLRKDRPRLGTKRVLCATLVLSFPEKLPHQRSVADTTTSTFGARQSGFSKKPPISCQSGQCSWELTHKRTVSPSNCRFLMSLHFQGGALILTSDTNHGGWLLQGCSTGNVDCPPAGLRRLVIQTNQAFLLFSGPLCLALSFLSSKPLVTSRVLTPRVSTAPLTPEKILILSLRS